jgi:hypothetical protein
VVEVLVDKLAENISSCVTQLLRIRATLTSLEAFAMSEKAGGGNLVMTFCSARSTLSSNFWRKEAILSVYSVGGRELSGVVWDEGEKKFRRVLHEKQLLSQTRFLPRTNFP